MRGGMRQGLGVCHKKIVKIDYLGKLEPGSDVMIFDLDDYMAFMAFLDYNYKKLDMITNRGKDENKEIHDLAMDSIKDSDKPPGEAIKEAGLKVVIKDNKYLFVRI
jgi:hypothetical protein